jgi:hypothetical protein
VGDEEVAEIWSATAASVEHRVRVLLDRDALRAA